MKFILVFLGIALAGGSGAAEPAKAASMAAPAPNPHFTRTIYLVRHGNYDDALKSDGEGGNGLTALGVAQARLVAARMSGMPVTFTSLTSSTMTRARQTAMVVNQSLPQLKLQTTPLLRECLPRTWQTQQIKDKTPAELDAAEAQLNEAFATYFVPASGADQHDILVCHGNVIRYLVTKALGVDTRAWLGFSVANCSLTIIQVNAQGGCKVVSVGDVGHIPPNLVSGLVRAPDAQLVAP
jgi:serine/threonine-protein phosphatase PGAM5